MKTTKACEVMTTNIITAKKDARLTDVMALLLRHHISGLPIVDDEKNLIGIISEIDLTNSVFSGNAADTTVEEVMTKSVISFPPETEMAELVQIFSSKRLRRVPIVDKGKLVGIVSRRDILREILKRYSSH
ncbi:MAG: CBS domain-containing protein [Sedimentisphaerales bacterium]|nr:CBS domain-containing protein [Sedimentisphaerales bacterium]